MDKTAFSRLLPAVAVLLLGIFSRMALSQTPTLGTQVLAYFNGTSFVETDVVFSTTEQRTFLFRTCTGGKLFSQSNSVSGQSISVSVDGTNGSIAVTWNVGGGAVQATVGTGHNNNIWTLVDFSYVAGTLELRVDNNVTDLASSTVNPTLLEVNLTGSTPFRVGDGFTGCFQEIVNVGLAGASNWSSVDWGVCPLDRQVGCGEQFPCASQPCQNNGQCSKSGSGYQCRCTSRFEGDNCEIDKLNGTGTLCDLPGFQLNCSNGGECVEDGTANSTICRCQPGFGGQFCNVSSTLCNSSTCANGGTCQTIGEGIQCFCVAGYDGMSCETNLNECEQNPCLNGGICQDKVNTFTCDCGMGYEGPLCANSTNECSQGQDPCQNAVTCHEIYNGYFCECSPGYTGIVCDTDIDECSSSPCQNGGNCSTPSLNSFDCSCPTGFEGTFCEINIDDCVGVTCPNEQECVDLVNNFMCRCPLGTTGPNCAEVDKCYPNPCSNGICRDGICYCPPGYIGPTCSIDFDDCLQFSPCQNGANCTDLPNDWICTCVPGYTSKNCSIDIDECASDPCANNATCVDRINAYECECVPGFNGTNCELDINECASSPCQNGGDCLNLINRFECNCTDTGFNGTFCSNNIDDCASSPCLNDATCQDLVKDFNCSCHDGYEGKNCGVDINECDEGLCQHGALCMELSNQTLYSPTNPYRNLLPSEFSFANSSGYVCVCQPGYTGSDCEIDIDECEPGPCMNGATCADLVNQYQCNCAGGWEGENCTDEIDECAPGPCMNGATCTDFVNEYRCTCAEGWGGMNCTVRLTACDGNTDCLNGATCVPSYNQITNTHEFTCACTPGFMGQFCADDTSSSFRGNEGAGQFIRYDLVSSGQSFNFTFSFATTIPDGRLLFADPVFGDTLVVEMVAGSLYLAVNDAGTMNQAEVRLDGLGSGLNDGSWHTVEVSVTSSVYMSVTSDTCLSGVCSEEQPFDASFSLGPFSRVYFGHIPTGYEQTLTSAAYTGCLRDIQDVLGNFILPPGPDPSNPAVELGCSRTPQCTPDPCNGQGRCTDLWWTYSCECQLGYTGVNCEYSFQQGTFSFENTTSYAIFDASSSALSPSENIIRLIFRTREMYGLLFYTAVGSEYIVLSVDNDTVQATTTIGGSVEQIFVNRFVSDGNYHTLEVTRQTNNFSMSLDSSSPVTTTLASSSEPSFNEFFVGGVSDFNAAGLPNAVRNSDYFKGCLWDIKYNNYSLEFFPLNIPNFVIDSMPIATNSNVISMCRSDDTCDPEPCENGGVCSITWNDFECDCPNGFGGKNCSEETICSRSPCPGGAMCVDRDGGYECVEAATFDGSGAMIKYNNSLNITRDISTISFRLRTRRDYSVVLHASNSLLGYFITIDVRQSKLVVTFNFGTRYVISHDGAIDDGAWHEVQLALGSPQTVLTVDGVNTTTSTSLSGTLQDVITMTGSGLVYLGNVDFVNNDYFSRYTPFAGCLDEVRIGTFLLPFFNRSVYNASNEEQFYADITPTVTIGCVGADVCNPSPCVNGNCSDMWNDYTCSCVPGFDGPTCSDNIDDCNPNPCLFSSTCIDLVNDYNCSCAPGYEGTNCSVDINECDSMPCQYGGTCMDEVNGFNCTCPTDFTGRMCEFNISVTCANVPCENNATCADLVNPTPGADPFTCTCLAGYEGTRCAYEIDYCESVTCQNGATCVSDRAQLSYRCDCPTGFTGDLCQTNTDDCVGVDCQFGGTCRDGVNSYTCDCVPGYTGNNCETNIDECASMPCVAGTCNDEVNGYSCTCPSNYEGIHCDQDVNECLTSDPCQNGGNCTNMPGNYSCQCPDNVYGPNCEHALCSTSPCQNNGTCTPEFPDSYVCNCTLGYVGDTCAVANCSAELCQNNGTCHTDAGSSRWECSCLEYYAGDRCELKGPCALEPCYNSGTCSQTLDADNRFTSECTCPIGFNGTFCENEINWCDSNPCLQQGSNCTSNRTTFNCMCAPGFGGRTCEIELPNCNSSLCQNGANCTDLPYDYVCTCVLGWTGKDCEIDVDDCEDHTCLNDARCEDRFNDFFCNCTGTGYQGTFCREDFPECDGANPCDNGGSCVELTGSFKCECADGFLGTRCEVMDPCFDQNPCQNGGTCMPLDVGNYTCTCPQGFTGDSCKNGPVGGPDWVIIGPSIAGGVLLIVLVLVFLILLIKLVRKKRATEGTYSPSRQEMAGSIVEMDNVLKMPPEERLI